MLQENQLEHSFITRGASCGNRIDGRPLLEPRLPSFDIQTCKDNHVTLIANLAQTKYEICTNTKRVYINMCKNIFLHMPLTIADVSE